ncbi:MAG: hypothetical protein IPJ76_13765 [Flavobacteriales bacterium]|nr:MAG: hypothetical protein IPJ76_13765 [Flavobacteriales bacterium]
MKRYFSPSTRDALANAKEEALLTGGTKISIAHLVLGLARSVEEQCGQLLAQKGLDQTFVREHARIGPSIVTTGPLVLSREGEELLKDSAFGAFLHSQRVIQPIHVLLTLLKSPRDPILHEHFLRVGLSYDAALVEFHKMDPTLASSYRGWLATGFFSEVIRVTQLNKLMAWT